MRILFHSTSSFPAMSLLLSLTSEGSEKKTFGYGTAQAMLLFPFFWSSPLIKLAVHRQDVGNQWPTDSLMRNLSQVICLGLVVPWEIQSYFPAGGLIPCSSDVHVPLLPTRTASLQPQISVMLHGLNPAVYGNGPDPFSVHIWKYKFPSSPALSYTISSQTSFLIFPLLR